MERKNDLIVAQNIDDLSIQSHGIIACSKEKQAHIQCIDNGIRINPITIKLYL